MDQVKYRRVVLVLAAAVLLAFGVGIATSLLSHGDAADRAASAATEGSAKSSGAKNDAKSGVKPAATTVAASVAAAVATPAAPPPGVEGWLEGVVGTPVAGSKVVVGGWAADRNAGAPVTKVEVLLDGKVVATANLGVERPDVAKTVGRDSYTRAGWNAVLDLAGVAPGKHEVSAVAYRNDGTRDPLEGARSIDVTPAS